MRSLGTITIGLAVVLSAGWFSPSPAHAQHALGRTTFGMEAGLPLVLGIEATQRVSPRWRLGLGLGRLGGLTAIRAEGRFLLGSETYERFVPSIIVGAEQYFLKKGDRDATPLGVHFAFGLDYHFGSPVSIGARAGGIKTFGSSGGGDLRVFSIENGYTSGTFNVGVRYHF
jgi:hypothetical protein